MTMPDTNGIDQQHDLPPDDQAAGHPAPASTDDDRTPASEQDADTADVQDDDDDDQDDGSRSNREKRYRLRLREAERERDELRDTLTRTRRAIVDNAVQAAGLDPRLLAAAGHTLDTLVGDDGLIDPGKLSEAVTVTAREFRITPKGRPPQPNRQQGTGSGQPPAKSSWADAIKGS